jgi:integrase
VLRSALSKAAAKNIISHNPAAGVAGIPAVDTDMVFLNIDEIQKLADTRLDDPYGAEVRRAFLFACYTGLRVSDLETVKWGRIETNPVQLIKSQEKTKSLVYIPLGPSAQKLILDGKEHKADEYVFKLREHNREAGYARLKEWAEKAKIAKRIGWHTARRTFATLALKRGESDNRGQAAGS